MLSEWKTEPSEEVGGDDGRIGFVRAPLFDAPSGASSSRPSTNTGRLHGLITLFATLLQYRPPAWKIHWGIHITMETRIRAPHLMSNMRSSTIPRPLCPTTYRQAWMTAHLVVRSGRGHGSWFLPSIGLLLTFCAVQQTRRCSRLHTGAIRSLIKQPAWR